MADPHWTSYVGMGTGIVGALTGIAGIVMGYIGYRKSTEIKSLDLRLELRRAISDLHTDLTRLNELLPYANQSHQRVAAATGNRGSGSMKIWSNQFEEDQASLSKLSGDAPDPEKEYVELTAGELEAKLVDVHKLQSQANELIKKYESALEADDKEREHIRENAMKLGGPKG